MNKRLGKKLKLNRETLRALQSKDVSRVVAGNDDDTITCSNHCKIESYCFCTDQTCYTCHTC
jgi:hypothetical protein